MIDSKDTHSIKPYFIRAVYEWCTDHGFSPYISVVVDDTVLVPMEYVRNGEIVLNISFDATGSLQLGDEYIEFKGRFGGVARDICVPVNRVMAIYARENGQGMSFPLSPFSPETAQGKKAPEKTVQLSTVPSTSKLDTAQLDEDAPTPPPTPPRGGGRPALKRVK